MHFQIALTARAGTQYSGMRGAGVIFQLGRFVTHPNQPDWGQGQVQSIVGTNVTVNFEHAGKQMINCQIIHLVKLPP